MTLPAYFAITDRRLCGGADALLARCALLAQSGVPAIQLREKDLAPAELAELARAILARVRHNGTILIINRDVECALATGADGVHGPPDADWIRTARQKLGPHALIGVSCHNRSELEAAQREGADYAFLSPVRAPNSKATDLAPLGWPGFTAAISGLTIPVYALGGMTRADMADVRAAGAAGIAAIGEFFGMRPPQAL